MEATFEEMRQIVEQHGLMCPECGTCEASFAAFKDWHELIKDRPSGISKMGEPVKLEAFDVESLLGMFDEDLRAYAKILDERLEKEKSKSRECREGRSD